MPHPQQDRNIAAPNAEVLRSIIRDWTTSTLTPGQIARLILQRINGTVSTQSLLAAAIDILREQTEDIRERESSRYADEINDLQNEVADLIETIAALHAKLAKGPTP